MSIIPINVCRLKFNLAEQMAYIFSMHAFSESTQ